MTPERIAAWEAWVAGSPGTLRERLERIVSFSPFPAARELARLLLRQSGAR